MMFSATEDDDFFTPTTSTNLASLFGQNIIPTTNERADLTYTAPKQRKQQADGLNNEKIDKKTGSVVCAKPVHLYKQIDESYKLIGKYALALVGDAKQAIEIILYKDKQNILTRASFVNFQFLLQNDNFLSFSDDNKQNWTMQFEISTDFEDFRRILKTRNISIKECRKKSQNAEEKSFNIDQHNGTIDLNNAKPKHDAESSDSSSAQARANILSRMAKMGQSILPNPILNDNVSDSETDECDVAKKVLRKPKRHNTNGKDLHLKSELPCDKINESIVCKSSDRLNTQLSSKTCSEIDHKQYTAVNSHQVPLNNSYTNPNLPQMVQSYPMLMNSMPMYDHFNVYLAENRAHNTDVRMNLTLIAAKVDNVLGEISKIKAPSNTDKLENEFLKSKIADLETKVLYLTRMISEKEAIPNDSDKELKEKDVTIKNLTKANEALEKSLNESLSLQEDINCLKVKEIELNKTIELKDLQLKDLEALHESTKDDISSQDTIDDLNRKIDNLNLKLKDFENYHHQNEAFKSNRKEINDSKIKLFAENTKQSMSAMFVNILEKFDESSTYTIVDIKKVLAVHMKHTTFDIIQDFQNQLKDNILDDVVDNNEGPNRVNAVENVDIVAPSVSGFQV